jgi:hypothetical protein
MKKVIVKIMLVVAVFAYGNVSFGQQKGGNNMTPEQRADKKMEELKGKLNLTPDQLPKVKEIVLNHENSRQKAIAAAGDDKDAKHAAMQKDREAFTNDMSKVLTPDQLSTLKTIEEHKPKSGTPQGGKN